MFGSFADVALIGPRIDLTFDQAGRSNWGGLIERLARADRGNAGWQGDLAASHGKLGLVHVALGDPATARRHFQAGRAIAAGLVGRFPDIVLWRRYLEQFDRDIARLPP